MSIFPIRVRAGDVEADVFRGDGCTRPKCRSLTRDLTGVCPGHRDEWRTGPRDTTDLGEWSPGTPHPTGGYDQVDRERQTITFRRGHCLHREDGPALVSSDYRKGEHTELWRRNDRPFRIDGPTEVRWSGGGTRHEEWLTRDGKLSRADGPAEGRYHHPTGGLLFERWRLDGVPHRIDGPALAQYRPSTGQIVEDSIRYAVQGVILTEEEFDEFRAAHESGVPIEWALAYSRGATV